MLLISGIPFNMAADANSAKIGLDTDVLNTNTIATVSGLLNAFGSMIPGFADKSDMINAIMNTLTSILGDTKTLNVNINFEKKK